MAAAEARAAWQRTTSRFFVQEDSRRAPRLTCCQPSCPRSEQVDMVPVCGVEGASHPPQGFMPLNRSPFSLNISPDSRLWLHLHPSYGNSNALASAQLNKVGCDEHIVPRKFNEPCFDSESLCFTQEKTRPWWLTTDRNELSSLITCKSLNHVENCDLPPPRKKHVRRDPSACLWCFDHNRNVPYSLDQEGPSGGTCNPHMYVRDSSGTESTDGGPLVSFKEDNFPHVSDNLFSSSATYKDEAEPQRVLGSDTNKTKLLEALCHSQTRAREAENAAKQAKAEMEHIVRLFLKQSSELFAYEQWFQLLQLESLDTQMKNNDQPVPNPFPMGLPQIANRDRMKKRPRETHDISKHAMAFAFGLGLISAGLIVGWTVGWMFPRCLAPPEVRS